MIFNLINFYEYSGFKLKKYLRISSRVDIVTVDISIINACQYL